MQRKKTQTDNLEVGDLVYYFPVHSIASAFQDRDEKPKLAIVVKTKNLLKLYDILVQTDNIFLKDIHISWLQKVS